METKKEKEQEQLFCQTVKPGDVITKMLVAGVLEKSYPGTREPAAVKAFLDAAFEEALGTLAGKTFREFDEFTLSGMKGRFLMRTAPSPIYADGHYFVMEQLSLMPVYLELTSGQAQEITLGVYAERLAALLNGEKVFDSAALPEAAPVRKYGFEHGGQWVNRRVEGFEGLRIPLKLKAGKNVLILLSGKIDRGTGISFSAELLKAEAPVEAAVPLNMPEEVRAEIALSQQRTHMIDDCLRVGEQPVLQLGNLPLKNCTVTVRVVDAEGKEAVRYENADTQAAASGELPLPTDLPAGKYTVAAGWQRKDGTPLTDAAFTFSVIKTLAPLPGVGHFAERRQYMVERLAEAGNPLALYRLGRYAKIDVPLVEKLCSRIDRLADCADFDLLPLLWLMWEDRDARLLSEEVHARVKKAALGFRYWVDEPGRSSMFYCSENHRIGFHVCEYLAGLLYPAELFTNCGQNGMYHSLKGRMHLMEWLSQRCRMGFDEPHSDNYLPVTLSALLVLREVLPMEEYPLRNMVNVLLDFMTYIFAVSNFGGIMATPRGRSYNEPLRSALFSSAGPVFWLLFGNAEANADPARMNAELAFSPYVPAEGLLKLADDFTPATFTFKQGLMHFDKHNADFTIRRTPEYMIGGVREHNVGLCDMHFISAMIALKNDVAVFFSAPNNVAEGSGLRPDYWAGQAFLPRVLPAKRTLAVIWHDVKDSRIWMTHCHFNRRRFDEVVQRDGWTFGRSGDGYVAIWSSVPHAFSEEGPYAGRELICPGRETVWLAECGSAREDGSFEQFIARMCAAEIRQEGDRFAFASPGSGRMAFGLSEGFTVDGEEVPVPQYTVDSPWLKSRFGSGRFDYDCPGFRVTQWTYPACE